MLNNFKPITDIAFRGQSPLFLRLASFGEQIFSYYQTGEAGRYWGADFVHRRQRGETEPGAQVALNIQMVLNSYAQAENNFLTGQRYILQQLNQQLNSHAALIPASSRRQLASRAERALKTPATGPQAGERRQLAQAQAGTTAKKKDNFALTSTLTAALWLPTTFPLSLKTMLQPSEQISTPASPWLRQPATAPNAPALWQAMPWPGQQQSLFEFIYALRQNPPQAWQQALRPSKATAVFPAHRPAAAASAGPGAGQNASHTLPAELHREFPLAFSRNQLTLFMAHSWRQILWPALSRAAAPLNLFNPLAGQRPGQLPPLIIPQLWHLSRISALEQQKEYRQEQRQAERTMRSAWPKPLSQQTILPPGYLLIPAQALAQPGQPSRLLYAERRLFLPQPLIPPGSLSIARSAPATFSGQRKPLAYSARLAERQQLLAVRAQAERSITGRAEPFRPVWPQIAAPAMAKLSRGQQKLPWRQTASTEPSTIRPALPWETQEAAPALLITALRPQLTAERLLKREIWRNTERLISRLNIAAAERAARQRPELTPARAGLPPTGQTALPGAKRQTQWPRPAHSGPAAPMPLTPTMPSAVSALYRAEVAQSSSGLSIINMLHRMPATSELMRQYISHYSNRQPLRGQPAQRQNAPQQASLQQILLQQASLQQILLQQSSSQQILSQHTSLQQILSQQTSLQQNNVLRYTGRHNAFPQNDFRQNTLQQNSSPYLIVPAGEAPAHTVLKNTIWHKTLRQNILWQAFFSKTPPPAAPAALKAAALRLMNPPQYLPPDTAVGAPALPPADNMIYLRRETAAAQPDNSQAAEAGYLGEAALAAQTISGSAFSPPTASALFADEAAQQQAPPLEPLVENLMEQLLSGNNMNQLADKVYETFERRLKFERRRFGL